MIPYVDASALVKRYVHETGTAAVRRILAGGVSATSRLSEVEVASALIRGCREGALSVEERDRALGALSANIVSMYVVELTPELSARATGLLLRHSLRSGDAIQLASCLHLRQHAGTEVGFLVFDTRLAEAARREGVAVLGSHGESD